jgi:hypothetical protein
MDGKERGDRDPMKWKCGSCDIRVGVTLCIFETHDNIAPVVCPKHYRGTQCKWEYFED